MNPRGGTIDWKGVSAIKGLSAFCRETIRDRLRANHHHLLDLLLAGSSPLVSLAYLFPLPRILFIAPADRRFVAPCVCFARLLLAESLAQ
jgi:hypothetical protein